MRKIYLLMIALLICALNVSYAQTRAVTGTVTENGSDDPLASVTVQVKGSSQGTQTNVNGKYQINIPATGVVTLLFTSVGYKTTESVVPANLVLNVKMSVTDNVLDQVVAIGYATVKRKEVTGASASVSGDELKLAPVTTAAQALTGKAAGVSVVTQSGAPGAPSNIVIRGASTITQGSAPLYIVDGFQMEDALREVDINDILTIDVLKDASATSIYGARGSNGVILITTKSGRKGKTEVNYNGYYGIERLGQKVPVMGVLDYTKYEYELQTLAGKESAWASYFGGTVTDPGFYTGASNYINSNYANRDGIDWQDLLFGGTASSQNHNISVSSGSEKTKFLLSYNNTGQNGIFAKHDYLRNGIRLKLNHEVMKNVVLDFNTNYQDTRVNGGGSLGGALKLTLLQPPTGGTRYTNDQLINSDISNDFLAYDSQYDLYNPIITNDAVTATSYNRQFTGNAGLDIGITKDLKFHTFGSYLWRQIRSDSFDDGRTRTAQNNLGPYGSRNNSERYSWQITNTLNWGHSFHSHNVNLLLGQETYYLQSMNLNNTYYQFPANNFGLNNVSQASGNTKNSYGSDLTKSSLGSFFGRASYNYKDRYILNFTLRADGSSKFGPENKWGYFPSVAGAWRISDESFMKNQNVLSDMKLRVGYGTAGNNNIDDYFYVTGYSGNSYAINKTNFQTLTPGSTVGNPAIKWETTKSTNIGLDLDFLKGRFTLSADVYNNESSDLLIRAALPPTSGYTSQFQNIGSIRNRGVELVLGSNNIATKQFRWKTNFNIAFNRSKVLALYGQSDQDYFISNYNSRVDFLIKVGQPLGQIYGYRYAGVYTTDDFTQNTNGTYTLKAGVPRAKSANIANLKPGDLKYETTAGEKDANGNPVWSTNDRTVIGNAQPKFQGGITNTFNYKGFDFTVFMNFAVGNKVFNANTQRFIGPYLPNQNTLTVMNNRYTLVDPNTGKESFNLSRLAQLNPQQFDLNALWSLHGDNKIAISDALDYYVEDGSYLRLSTITLGYTIPKSIMQKVRLTRARLYCTLNNIHTFTKYKGYDPAVSATSSILTQGIDDSAYPVSKSVVFGVNVSF
jgi:TonB-linked SusC/RagA family outer membrane protein